MSTIHTTMLSLCLLTSSRLMFHHCLSSNLSTRHVATRLILLTSSCTLTIADCYSEALRMQSHCIRLPPLSSTHCYTLSTLFTFIHTCSSSVLPLLFTAWALTFSTVLLMLCSATVAFIVIPMCLVVLLLTCNCNVTCHLVSGLTTTCLTTSVLSLFKPTQQFLPAEGITFGSAD